MPEWGRGNWRCWRRWREGLGERCCRESRAAAAGRERGQAEEVDENNNNNTGGGGGGGARDGSGVVGVACEATAIKLLPAGVAWRTRSATAASASAAVPKEWRLTMTMTIIAATATMKNTNTKKTTTTTTIRGGGRDALCERRVASAAAVAARRRQWRRGRLINSAVWANTPRRYVNSWSSLYVVQISSKLAACVHLEAFYCGVHRGRVRLAWRAPLPSPRGQRSWS